MTNPPWYLLVWVMLLVAQVDPVQGQGAKGAQHWSPVPPPAQPHNPMRPGQPLWWLTTQVPIWLVIILAVRRQQQALAERCKLLADEEETKSSYVEEDLVQDFEFKIVRNELNLFEQPQLLAEALREEAQAGWQFVEKFDGNRVRLKRPASARANDAALPPDYDPYRTAALAEATRSARAAKRGKDLKIIGSVLAASATLAIVCGLAAGALPTNSLGKILAIVGSICAGLVAAMFGIGLFVRCFSK